jgi:hypothetical protein
LILALAACAPPVGTEKEGNFTLILPGDGRTLSPETIAGLSYRLEFRGPGGETVYRNTGPGTGRVTLNLSLGKWTILLRAYTAEGVFYGTGETSVTVEAGKTNEAGVAVRFLPAWHVFQWGSDVTGTGSEEAPFATVQTALYAVAAAYETDWPGHGTSAAVPARILIRGTVSEPGTGNGMVDISEPSMPMYTTYPPIILAGGSGGGILDATGPARRVLNIDRADVTLEEGLTLIHGQPASGDGAGVHVNGLFTMNGGAIMDSDAVTGMGGGVCVAAGGSFTMNGGTIGENHATVDGGGVAFSSPGAFTMNGGTIRDNISGDTGGGVFTLGPTGNFVMNGGTISGNVASSHGGGVIVASYGNFTMSGNAVISGNTASSATSNGGGVCVDTTGTFNKTGGTIYGDDDNVPDNGNVEDNTAASGDGHAVYTTTGSKKRNSTAYDGDSLDSTYIGPIPGGGWE